MRKEGVRVTEDQTKETEQPSGESVQASSDIPLLDRISSDVLAVAFIDYGKILEKGGQISALPIAGTHLLN